jgi:hypothetical protein
MNRDLTQIKKLDVTGILFSLTRGAWRTGHIPSNGLQQLAGLQVNLRRCPE